MNYGMFSMHDAKAGIYSQPFYAPNRAVAQRHFQAAMDDPQSMVSKFPADFRLYEVGVFNDVTGVVLSHDPAVLIFPAQE